MMYYYNGMALKDSDYEIVKSNIQSILSGMESCFERDVDQIKRKNNFNRKDVEKALNRLGIQNKRAQVEALMSMLEEYHALDLTANVFDKKVGELHALTGIQDTPCVSKVAKREALKSKIKESADAIISQNIKSDNHVDFGIDSENTGMVYSLNNDGEMEIKDVTSTDDYSGRPVGIEAKNTGLRQLIEIYLGSRNLDHLQTPITFDDIYGFDPLFDEKLTSEQKREEIRALHTPAYGEISWLISPLFSKNGDLLGVGELRNDETFARLKEQLSLIKGELSRYCSELTVLADLNVEIESIKALQKMLGAIPDSDPYKPKFLKQCEKKLAQLSKEKSKQEQTVAACPHDPSLVAKAKEIDEELHQLLKSYISQKDREASAKNAIVEDAITHGVSAEDFERLKNEMPVSEFNKLANNVIQRGLSEDPSYKKPEEYDGRRI